MGWSSSTGWNREGWSRSGFVGVGDLVSSWGMYCGLRGYSAAYAAPGTGPAITVTKASDGSVDTIINILPNGSLDVATIAALGYAVKVKKIWDQTLNGNDLTQATLASMPGLTLSGLGTLPILTFDGIAQTISATGLTLPLTSTLLIVANSTNTATQQTVFGTNSGSGPRIGFNNSGANTAFVFQGVVLTASSVNDGAWHSIQGMFNGASSSAYVNGSTFPGPAGTNTPQVGIFLSSTAGEIFKGSAFECGFHTSQLTAQNSAIDGNVRTYCGF